jgi:hypothetical protein
MHNLSSSKGWCHRVGRSQSKELKLGQENKFLVNSAFKLNYITEATETKNNLTVIYVKLFLLRVELHAELHGILPGPKTLKQAETIMPYHSLAVAS